MRAVGPDKTYIDYFQGVSGLSNQFGIRVCPGSCSAVVKNGNGQAHASGKGKQYSIPTQLQKLPLHLRLIVEDHVLNYPASDLIDVLTGRKLFQEALEFPPKSGTKWMTAGSAEQPPLHDRHAKLKIELEICLRSANLASLMYQNGNKDAAERTSADVERFYAMIVRSLSDWKDSEFTAKMEELRKTLDDLHSRSFPRRATGPA